MTPAERDALVKRLQGLKDYCGQRGSITRDMNIEAIDQAIALLTAPAEAPHDAEGLVKSANEKAAAWDYVCDTLTKHYPDWSGLHSRGDECAVRAIKLLAQRAPLPQSAPVSREELPPGYTDIDDYIAEQEKDPVKAEALRQARIRLREHMREALRSEVIEECAKVCEQKGASFTIHNFSIPATGLSAANICANSIRSLAAHPAEPAGKGA